MRAADASSYIFRKQLLWAQRRNVALCGSAGARGRLAYTQRLEDNLFEPLTAEARREYASARLREELAEEPEALTLKRGTLGKAGKEDSKRVVVRHEYGALTLIRQLL